MNQTSNTNLSRRDLIRTGFAGAGILAVGGVSTGAWLADKNRAEIIKNPSGAQTVFFNDEISNYSGDEGVIEGLHYIAETFNTVDSNNVKQTWGRLTVDDQVWSTKTEMSVIDSLATDDLAVLENLKFVVVDPDGEKENITLDGYDNHGRRLLPDIDWPDTITHAGRVFSSHVTRFAERCTFAVRAYRVPAAGGAPASSDWILEVNRLINGAWQRSRYHVGSLTTGINFLNLVQDAHGTWNQIVAATDAARQTGEALTAALVAAESFVQKGGWEAMQGVAGGAADPELLATALSVVWPEICGFALIGGATIASLSLGFMIQMARMWAELSDTNFFTDITPDAA